MNFLIRQSELIILMKFFFLIGKATPSLKNDKKESRENYHCAVEGTLNQVPSQASIIFFSFIYNSIML